MVMEALEHHVAEIGQAARFPRNDVMHIGKGHVRAIGEPAMSIPSPYLSALGLGRETPGPAFVHGVSDVVVDRYRNGGVTGDPAHRFGVDEADVIELAGECSALA